MRAIPWRGRFDAVVDWFTSFGYHDDDELRTILRGVHGALRPGGRFALETVNVTWLLGHLRPAGITERDGDFLLERGRFDPVRGGIETEYVAVRGAERPRYALFIRLPTFPELRDWLLAAGFARVEAYGEDGEPLATGHRRLVALAYA